MIMMHVSIYLFINCFILAISSSNAIFRAPSSEYSQDFVFEPVHQQDHSASHAGADSVIDTVARKLATNSEAVLQLMDVCGGFSLIADQMPNGVNSCTCNNSTQEVQCTFQVDCATEEQAPCTDVVGLSFQFLVDEQDSAVNRMKLSACFTYTEEFEPTCIEPLIGRGQTLEACSSATYGGKRCDCAICDDSKSLSLDCSDHHPGASSNGCYLLSDALPVLSKFDEAPQGSRRVEEDIAITSAASITLQIVHFLMIAGVGFVLSTFNLAT